MNTDALLQRYADRFVTYGNRAGRLWFLDYEDDRYPQMDAVAQTVASWDATGRRSTYRLGTLDGFDDVRDQAIFDTRRATGPELHQPFAIKSRIALGLDGPMIEQEARERDAVRVYQATRLGTLRGDTCLLQPFPVPYHPRQHWYYDGESELPWMASREAFEAALLVPRLERVRELVRRHRPAALVTFCWYHRDAIERVLDSGVWSDVSGKAGLRQGARQVRFGRLGDTLLVLTSDARMYRSPSREFCWNLGRNIAERT